MTASQRQHLQSDAVETDGYLDLQALSQYAHLSRRTLRGFINDPKTPMPHYRMKKGKILVKTSEFDGWMRRFKISKAEKVKTQARPCRRRRP